MRVRLDALFAAATLLALTPAIAAEEAKPAAKAKAAEQAAPAATETTVPDVLKAEWPCVARKVAEIQIGQIWDGPPLDKALETWRNNDLVRNLSGSLVSRGVKESDAEEAVKKFAEEAPEAGRDEKLLELFAAVLARSNEDRKIVLSGIERFHKRQVERAKAIEAKGVSLDTAKPAGAAVPENQQRDLTPEEATLQWDVRIFQERQQNIPIACEIPMLIDERAGALARAIRSHMKN